MQDRGMHGIPAMPRYDSAGTRVPRNTIPDRASISEGLWRPTACSDCLLRHLQRFEFLPRKPSILENTEIPRARFHAEVTEPGKSFASRNSSFLPRLGSPAFDRVIGESVETYRTVGIKVCDIKGRLIAVYLYRASNRLTAAFGFYGTWEPIYGTRVRNNRNRRARYSLSIRDVHRKRRSRTL